MSLDQAIEEKFSKIAKVLAIEISAKLSSILNCSATVSYSRLIDSMMANKKISIKKDSFLVSIPITTNNLGPISVIASNQQVVVIAELATGGDGDAAETVAPSEDNEKTFAETVNSVINSAIARLCKLKEGLNLTTGEQEARALKAIQEPSLKLPNNIEDSVGIGLKIKIAKLDSPLQIELNSKAIEFLVEELYTIINELDEDRFSLAVNQEYQSATTNNDSEDSDESEDTTAIVNSGSEYEINEKRNLKFIRDINIELILELGRSEMMMKDVLRLTKGSAIELDRPCSQSVDLYAHNQLVARGEVVAIDDSFGLKITELVGNLNLANDLGLKAR